MKAAVTLYPYQQEALQAVRIALSKHRSTLVVMPTGCGKTVLFAAVAELARRRGRILVLAHREELIEQAKAKIEWATDLRCGIEMGERTTVGGIGQLSILGEAPVVPDVVVASVQTMARERRRRAFARDEFYLIVVDEAHHAIADSYKEVLDYFSSAKVLGVTATADRADGGAMREAFESVAFVYEIRDAIEQGFLVPIRQRTVEIESLDLSKVRRNRETGDLMDSDLEEILMDERVLHEMAVPTVELAGDRPTIVFTATVAHAQALTEVISRYSQAQAKAVWGDMDKDARRATIADFSAGRVQYLCNCMLLTEGFDAPPTACVSVARPTTSRALFTQMVGRGTRLSPATGKKDLLVLDLAGNSGKHSLVSTVDILDGNRDQNVRQLALKLMSENQNKTTLEALDEAAARYALDQRQQVVAEARFKAKDVDPFQVLGAPNKKNRWGGVPATEKQLATLAQAGIEIEEGTVLERGQAGALIDKIFERRRSGLCSYKQARLLVRYGLNPDVPFEKAKQAIDTIAAARWKRSPALYPELFQDEALAPRQKAGVA